MSENNLLTVLEYSKSIGKSKQSVYNRVNRGTIPTTTVNGKVYIEVDKIDNSTDNKVNELKKPLLTEFTDIEYKSLKKEIKKLKKSISKKDLEIRNLLERIITLEKEQKEEIIRESKSKHEELKLYMDFIQKQTENKIEYKKEIKEEEQEEIIEADIETKKKDKKKKKKKWVQ